MQQPDLAIIVTASALVLTAGLAACGGGGGNGGPTVGGGSGGGAQLDLVIGDSVPLTGGLATVRPVGGS